METIDLTPNYKNVAKYMASALKYNEWPDDDVRYDFSTQLQEILGYLKRTNIEEYREVMKYINDLADRG